VLADLHVALEVDGVEPVAKLPVVAIGIARFLASSVLEGAAHLVEDLVLPKERPSL